MKKTSKKLLTLALSMLFVGAGVGSVAALNNADAQLLASAETITLTWEEAKVKNIDTYSYVESGAYWHFEDDGTHEGNPEFRFVTEGTNTNKEKPYDFQYER